MHAARRARHPPLLASRRRRLWPERRRQGRANNGLVAVLRKVRVLDVRRSRSLSDRASPRVRDPNSTIRCGAPTARMRVTISPSRSGVSSGTDEPFSMGVGRCTHFSRTVRRRRRHSPAACPEVRRGEAGHHVRQESRRIVQCRFPAISAVSALIVVEKERATISRPSPVETCQLSVESYSPRSPVRGPSASSGSTKYSMSRSSSSSSSLGCGSAGGGGGSSAGIRTCR